MKSNRRVRPSLEEVCEELVEALIIREARAGKNYEFGYACMFLGDQAHAWQSEPHRWIVVMASTQLQG